MGNQTVILACPTLAGELKEAMKEAQSDSVVYFMPPGLHRDPKVLHHYVQDKIDHFYNVSKSWCVPQAAAEEILESPLLLRLWYIRKPGIASISSFPETAWPI